MATLLEDLREVDWLGNTVTNDDTLKNVHCANAELKGAVRTILLNVNSQADKVFSKERKRLIDLYSLPRKGYSDLSAKLVNDVQSKATTLSERLQPLEETAEKLCAVYSEYKIGRKFNPESLLAVCSPIVDEFKGIIDIPSYFTAQTVHGSIRRSLSRFTDPNLPLGMIPGALKVIAGLLGSTTAVGYLTDELSKYAGSSDNEATTHATIAVACNLASYVAILVLGSYNASPKEIILNPVKKLKEDAVYLEKTIEKYANH